MAQNKGTEVLADKLLVEREREEIHTQVDLGSEKDGETMCG